VYFNKFSSWGKAVIASALVFSLSSCFIQPGEFNSTLTVNRNGNFSFAYKGQIQLVSNPANQASQMFQGPTEFEAKCFDEVTTTKTYADGEDIPDQDTSKSVSRAVYPNDDGTKTIVNDTENVARACKPAEVKKQKAEWDSGKAERAAEQVRKKAESENILKLYGGMNFDDPEMVARFTREVEKLAGFNKIEHLGDGVFMVDYSTTGRLADGFAFPIFPSVSVGAPMLYVTRLDDGSLSVVAPAYRVVPEDEKSSTEAASNPTGQQAKKAIPVKGSFTLTTDAPILMSNSKSGAVTAGTLKTLRWDIGPGPSEAPKALLKLAP
jgi:hypothetical protein